MENRLFVGNIPFSANDDTLSQHFGSAGEVVSVKIIVDRETGRSKGFGFVEMANEEDAKKAIDELNSKEFEGRTLTVNIARPREDRGGGRR